MNNQRYPYRNQLQNTRSGLEGLTQNVGKRQSARQDLNTMGQLLNLKKQDEAEEMQAAAMEQATYEKIHALSSEMLKGDRERINKKALELQNNIKEKIKMFGGSRASFIKNGGASVLADYSSNLMNSEEFLGYKDNKANLDKLLKMQMSGMGHLIAPEDYKNMVAYNLNGEGPITFSGVLNEITIPPQAFAYGHKLTPEEVLSVKDNRMKIYGNFQTIYPNEPPPTEERLKRFVVEQNYGGMGENVQILQLEESRRREYAKRQKELEDAKLRDTPTSKTARFINKPSLQNVAFKDMSKGILGSDEDFNSMIGAKQNKDQFTKGDNGNLNRPRGSYITYDSYDEKYAKSIFADNYDEESKNITFNGPIANKDLFDSSGNKISANKEIKGNYQPGKILMAFGGNVGNASNPDSEIIFMDILKDNGEIDEEAMTEIYGDGKSTTNAVGKAGMYLVLKNTDDDEEDLYVKIPYENQIDQVAFKDAIGLDEEYIQEDTKTRESIVEQRAQLTKEARDKNGRDPNQLPDLNNYQKLSRKELQEEYEIAGLNYQKTENDAIFKSDIFKNNAIDAYTVRGLSGDVSNRELLIKTFYQATSNGDSKRLKQTVEGDYFKTAFDVGAFPELYEMLLKPDVDDRDIMKFYMDQEKNHPANEPELDKVFAIDKLWDVYYQKALQSQSIKK